MATRRITYRLDPSAESERKLHWARKMHCDLYNAANERGWLWCQSLGLWLGTWEGEIQREIAVWLRFYDSEGSTGFVC